MPYFNVYFWEDQLNFPLKKTYFWKKEMSFFPITQEIPYFIVFFWEDRLFQTLRQQENDF